MRGEGEQEWCGMWGGGMGTSIRWLRLCIRGDSDDGEGRVGWVTGSDVARPCTPSKIRTFCKTVTPPPGDDLRSLRSSLSATFPFNYPLVAHLLLAELAFKLELSVLSAC